MAKAKKTNEVDVTYASGWLRGQLAAEDATDGMRHVVPGLLVRVRLDQIVEYAADEPGVIAVSTKYSPKGFGMYGKIETLDKIMSRHFGPREVVSDA